jgi:hypothetical protein
MSRWITMYSMNLNLQLYLKEKHCKSITLHLRANKCRWKQKDLKNQDRMLLKVILMVTAEATISEAAEEVVVTFSQEEAIEEGIMIIDFSPSISQF